MSFRYFFTRKQLFFLFLIQVLWPSFIYSFYLQDRSRVEVAINMIYEKRISPELSLLVSKLNKNYSDRMPIFFSRSNKNHEWTLLENLQKGRGFKRNEGNITRNDRQIPLEKSKVFLPNEMWELVLLHTIPKAITTKRDFQESLKTLSSLAVTSKTFEEFLSTDFFKKIILPRIFNTLVPEAFNELMTEDICESLSLTIPKKVTVLKSIKSVLLDIYILRKKRSAFGCKRRNVKKTIKKLVNVGLNPNLFVKKSNNLFHIAIRYDFPSLVDRLIKNGADITMKNLDKLKNESIKKIEDNDLRRKAEKRKLSCYNQIPFVLAFRFSPKSALILLGNTNIDIDAIKIELPKALTGSYNYEVFEIIKELVEKGIDPNTEITEDSAYMKTISLFGYVATIIWHKYFDRIRISSAEKTELLAKSYEIVTFLLGKGASLDKSFQIYPRCSVINIRNLAQIPGFKEIFEEHEERSLKGN